MNHSEPKYNRRNLNWMHLIEVVIGKIIQSNNTHELSICYKQSRANLTDDKENKVQGKRRILGLGQTSNLSRI